MVDAVVVISCCGSRPVSLRLVVLAVLLASALLLVGLGLRIVLARRAVAGFIGWAKLRRPEPRYQDLESWTICSQTHFSKWAT